jgi:hypothetical protein
MTNAAFASICALFAGYALGNNHYLIGGLQIALALFSLDRLQRSLNSFTEEVGAIRKALSSQSLVLSTSKINDKINEIQERL